MEPSQPTSGPAPISVTDPITRAVDWTAQVLFKPFDVGKWFALGFCAWLAWMGQGGGGGSSNWNWPSDDSDYGVSRAGNWIQDHLSLVVILSMLLFVVILSLILLFTWLSSRGKFMFLDGVIHNRGAVVEPWHRFRALGNSLFGLRIVIGVIALVVFGTLVGLLALVVFTLGLQNLDPGAGAIVLFGLWLIFVAILGICFGLIAVALNDIVVPIMWLRGCRVMEAWSEFLSLLAAHTGTFALYVVMKILLGVALLMIGCIATCFTCCIAALPYIGTVLLLPLFVFRRSYSIYFLSQFGPDYASLAPAVAGLSRSTPPTPPAPPAPPLSSGPSTPPPSPGSPPPPTESPGS